MNSFAIGWKKQAPDMVHYSTRKFHSHKKPARKNEPPKQQQTAKTIERQVPKIVRPNKPLSDDQPYAPLEASIFSAVPARRSKSVIPINWDTSLCTTRSAVVTFIIIFILIIAAGASIGIVFAAINSKNPSGSGSNSNQDLFTTVSSGTFTSSVSIGSQSGLPCLSYTTINDPSRNENVTSSNAFCDNGPLFNTSRGGAWIRFIGTGGTIIPLSPPAVQRCSTFLPGWFNGTLPTVPNIATNASACFTTYADDCGFPIDISAVYCTGSVNFYVYFLPPVSTCSARYCTT